MNNINLSAEAILRFLLYIIAGLLFMHITMSFLYYVHGIEILPTLRGRFDVDNEISVPTWFSQLLLVIPALLSFVLVKISRDQKDGNHKYWAMFGTLFLFLSVDEGAMLHEAFITKFREWTTAQSTTGLANHTWLIPVLFVLSLILIPLVKFLRRLPTRTIKLLSVGLAVFFFGAIVYETIGLIYVTGDFAYRGLNVALEEGLEMVGVTIVGYSLLDYLRSVTKSITITLR